MISYINYFTGSCTFDFLAHIILYRENGGAFMLSLCMSGILGFIEFLKSAIFVVRIYYTEVTYFLNH